MTRKLSTPEHWTGDNQSFENRIKEVAEDLKKMIASRSGPVFDALGTWFAKVILDNQRGQCRVERTPWDSSSYGCSSGESFDLSEHETVGEFLDNEYTGSTIATYCSGSGFSAETFGDSIQYVFRSVYDEMFKSKYPDLFDQDDFIPDEVRDSLERLDAEDCLFEDTFRKMPLIECFTKYLGQAMILRAEEAEQRRQCIAEKERIDRAIREIAGNIPNEIESFAGNIKYEKSNWNILLKYLHDISAVYGKNAVSAALALSRISASNSVEIELKKRFPRPKV